MLTDGYTLHGGLGSLRFDYRPALDMERRVVIPQLRFQKSEQLLKRFIRRHVEWLNREPLSDDQWIGLFHVCMGVIPPEHGGDWAKDWEKRDADNLYEGVILEIRHPVFARRDCGACRKWWYDDETGAIKRKNGKDLLRPIDSVLLCETHDGCPKGTPEKPRNLSPKNRLAWKHFRECKAVGQFPDDPIVRRNAWIIERALKKAHERR